MKRTPLNRVGKGGANPPRPDAKKRSGSARRSAARRKAVLNGRKWRAAVFAMHGDRCAMTGEQADHAHHVLALSFMLDHLPGRFRAEGLDEDTIERRVRQAARDPRNGMPLSELAHHRHERALERVPFDRLKPCHRQFAAELGLTWYLDRTYPKTTNTTGGTS